MLHLETQKKVWLEQNNHFDEIYIWLHHTYLQHNPDPFEDLREEVEEIKEEKELEQEIEKQKSELNGESKKRLKKLDEEFANPLQEMFEEGG